MIDQVNQSPTVRNVADLLPILRQYGYAINTLIAGLEIVSAADLPPPSLSLDGHLVVEQAGGGQWNLVLYTKNTRTRFTGTNF